MRMQVVMVFIANGIFCCAEFVVGARCCCNYSGKTYTVSSLFFGVVLGALPNIYGLNVLELLSYATVTDIVCLTLFLLPEDFPFGSLLVCVLRMKIGSASRDDGTIGSMTLGVVVVIGVNDGIKLIGLKIGIVGDMKLDFFSCIFVYG